VEVKNAEMPDAIIGIGTIKNLHQAKIYLDAGAAFLVSAGYDGDVAAYCTKHDIFYGPGCMTPTEIQAAENAGVKFVKTVSRKYAGSCIHGRHQGYFSQDGYSCPQAALTPQERV